ncbi:MAG: MEDS domain-containing protein [Casimicrobiaceae bacterium]
MRIDTRASWGEIPPWEHLVQFYSDETAFLDTLEGFIGGGLRSGDSAIVIATPEHLSALETRMARGGIDVERARQREQYVPLDAAATLDLFMVGVRPDPEKFMAVLEHLLARAQQGEWKVRAFGEMVVLLLARGNVDATLELEHLWQKACAKHGLSLLCAYPASVAGEAEQVEHICRAHSRVLAH